MQAFSSKSLTRRIAAIFSVGLDVFEEIDERLPF